jgi:hypothetical protein
MPTLSIVKKDFIKAGKWGGIAIGALILLIIIFRAVIFVKEIFIPSAPPPPTVAFGKLPKIFFPEGIKRNFTYKIDTITGELPTLPPSEKVFKMQENDPDILAVEKANERVASVGFNPQPQQISDFIYRYRNPSVPNQILILNTKLAEFNLTSSYLNYQNQLTGNNFSNKSQPITAAKSFLENMDFYPTDIDEEKTRVDFGILEGGIIKPTTRVADSNVATVYFYQKAKDDLPIVYPQGAYSSMRMMVGAGKLMGKILDGKFSHQNITDDSATYPIKSANQAFDELKAGKGYIATYAGSGNDIVIKDVYIGLYNEGRSQQYLTPVIVFEGSEDFVGYVPAIKGEWIDK